MKIFSLMLFCAAALVAFTPAEAQSRRSKSKRSAAKPAAAAVGAAAEEEEAEAKTGPRFVICSPTGVNMPSPLYVRKGKGFTTISIGSRNPSVRVKPLNGVVDFWDKDPTPAKDDKDKKKGAAGDAAPAADELPEPIFSVKVPGSAGSKSVCILSPNKDVKKTTALFINEADFPRKGMHVINLSSYPLQLITSASADFKDKKTDKIGVYRREDGISAENTWSFKGEKGQQVSFILSYYDKKTKKMKRMRASSFVLSDRQSMINVVVKDQTRDMPKLMPIQISEGDKSSKGKNK